MRRMWSDVTEWTRASLRMIASLSTRNGASNEFEYAQNMNPMIAAIRSACLIPGDFTTGGVAVLARLPGALPLFRISLPHFISHNRAAPHTLTFRDAGIRT